MSLINDALKRARETQPKGFAPSASPALRPVEAADRSVSGNDVLLPALIVVILLLGCLLLWVWFRGDGGELKVRARTSPISGEIVPTPAVIQPAPVTAQPVVAAIDKLPEPITNAAIAVEPPKPAPLVYKLQSIFYRPKSPSAVINGKPVFIGSLVANARVVAIGKDSATIVTAAGQTKLLELP